MLFEYTTANIENNECKWLGGLADDSLCILNSSQLRMLKEHVTHSATVVLFTIKSWKEVHQEVNALLGICMRACIF